MFRLVKIVGSKNNIPEVERFSTVGCYSPIEEGCAMNRFDDTLGPSDLDPEYIVIKNTKSSKYNDMLAFRITPDMIFKVDFVDEEPPERGRYVRTCKIGKAMQGVCYDDSGKGRIIRVCDNPNYVYVKFDCKALECEC